MFLRRCLLFLLVWHVGGLHSLKIHISRPSEIVLQEGHDAKKFYHLMTHFVQSPSLWPLLVPLLQAKYFDYEKVFSNVLAGQSCAAVLRLAENGAFPRELLSADTVAMCHKSFNQLSVKSFAALSLGNPLESRKFQPDQWSYTLFAHFLERGLREMRVNMRWCDWSRYNHPGTRLNHEFVYLELTHSPVVWHIINHVIIRRMDSSLALRFLEQLNPGGLGWSRMLTSGWRLILRNGCTPQLAERDLLMRVIITAVFYTHFPRSNACHREARNILLSFKARLSERTPAWWRMFRSRAAALHDEMSIGVLVPDFVRLVTTEKPTEDMANMLARDTRLAVILTQLLDRLREFTPQASWILNLFYLWTRHACHPSSHPPCFMNAVLYTFFSGAPTAEDCSHLFTLISEEMRDSCASPRSLVLQICNNHLVSRPLLAQAIFRHYSHTLPLDVRHQSPAFSPEMRFTELLRSRREIKRHGVMMDVNIETNTDSHAFVLDVLIVVYNGLFKQNKSLLPFNTRVCYYRKGLLETDDERLKNPDTLQALLKDFFDALQHGFGWMQRPVTRPAAADRPVMIPSLKMPPQLMRMVGVLLGKAAIMSVRLPFILDYRYFSCGSSPAAFVPDGYHANRDGCLTGVHDVYRTLNHPASVCIQYVRQTLVAGHTEQRNSELCLSVESLAEIVTASVDQLMDGLSMCIDEDNFSLRELHDMIFQ